MKKFRLSKKAFRNKLNFKLKIEIKIALLNKLLISKSNLELHLLYLRLKCQKVFESV